MRTFLSLAGVCAGCLSLVSCGGTSYSYQNVTVTISPQISTINVGATQTFTTVTSNAPNYPVFYVYPQQGAVAGTLTFQTGGATATYTAPATPPIYTAAQVQMGAVQGQAGIEAFVSNSTTQLFSDAEAHETFTVLAPSITAGIQPTTASVARGGTYSFMGYAVGSTNGAVTFQVNGVTGGSTAFGTISTTGVYTAPSAIPVNGPTVTVTVVSVGDVTKTASATVTIT